MRSIKGAAEAMKRCGVDVVAIRQSTDYDGEIILGDGRVLRLISGKVQTTRTR